MPNSQKLITLENLTQFKTKTDATYYKKTDKVASATVADSANAVAWANVSGKPSLATLDTSGKVPASQLPSYVDDVLEYDNRAAFPETGEAGKIYIAKDTNLQYRWSGTAYVEISSSLALGETASTAYAGNKGKQNADDIAAIKAGTIKVGSAANADTATSATKAQQDSNGNIIVNHYATRQQVLDAQNDADDANTAISEIVNGTQAVGLANKATADGAGANIASTYAKKTELPTIDSELSETSTNPVQNKVVKEKIDYVIQHSNTVAESVSDDFVEGTLTAKKAECDAAGNVISTTYAKKSEIPEGVTVDSALSSTSTNPVQNKVVKAAIDAAQADAAAAQALAETAESAVSALETDLESGDLIPYKAGRADADASGQGIIETYAKKTELTTLVYAQNTEIDALFA